MKTRQNLLFKNEKPPTERIEVVSKKKSFCNSSVAHHGQGWDYQSLHIILLRKPNKKREKKLRLIISAIGMGCETQDIQLPAYHLSCFRDSSSSRDCFLAQAKIVLSAATKNDATDTACKTTKNHYIIKIRISYIHTVTINSILNTVSN